MNPSDLAASISNSLTQMDTMLASGNPPFTSPQWQQLFALRKHLDDQQRTLLQQTIQSNDAAFQQAAANLKTATTNLTAAIAQQATVDSIINIVSQVSAVVDAVLKAL
jgi:transcriptional regulator with GAF, ATPase, and Fis domain